MLYVEIMWAWPKFVWSIRPLLAGTMILALSSLTHAQLSPGKLSKAHASLEGPLQCGNCHTFGAGEPTPRCVHCHEEIGTGLAQGRGYHVKLMRGSSDEKRCTACHKEHAGVEYQPIPRSFPSSSFVHADTGFPLEGAHNGVECRECHRQENITPTARGPIRVKDLGRTYFGLRGDCAICHQDVHKGTLGGECTQCHGMDAWKPVLSFDHSATRFPLTGEHTKVACEGCHRQGAVAPRELAAAASANARRGAASAAKATLATRTFGGIPFGDCDACHKDPHPGSFKFSCFQCHKTTGWFDLKGETPFSHSTTGFDLKGAHAVVACKECHTSANFRQPVAHEQCLDCHQDPHKGQFLSRAKGECATCHNETNFHPSLFDVSMHGETAFPLIGKHATVECTHCHPGEKAAADFHPAFGACLDCHEDAHQGQVAEAPWKNDCGRCHTSDGFAPSLISLQDHRQWEFPLEGAHRAVPCGECHAKSAQPPNVLAANARAESNWAFRPQAQQCRDCHVDPHGFEAGAMVTSGGAPDCSECHAVSGWNTTRPFDHQRTAFALKGAHRTVSCLQCHHVAGKLTANLRLAFHEAPKSCAECHEDVHGRQFAPATGEGDCESCHAEERWKPSKFDHERQSAFSLVGAHQEVPCRQCHTHVETRDERPVLIYAGVPRGCAECHQ